MDSKTAGSLRMPVFCAGLCQKEHSCPLRGLFLASTNGSQVISSVCYHCSLQWQGGRDLLNATLLQGDSWLIPSC